MKKKAVIAFLLGSAHVLCADVYYNAKTFSESETNDETVYIGHENGGDFTDALVTVKSGAVWTNTQTVVLGATPEKDALLTVESGASVNFATLNIAFNGKTESGLRGEFELQENARAMVTNINLCYVSYATKLEGNVGVVRLGSGSLLSGIQSFYAGHTNCTTRIEMQGGEIEFESSEKAPDVSMYIGNNYKGYYTGCVLSGWGIVGFSNANLIMNNPARVGRESHHPGQFRLYGQVIADGKGVARDLDFSHAGVPATTSTDNVCGTNGWYAVNKGRLLMPRFPQRWRGNSQTVGTYPYSFLDNELVNSFRYVFDDTTIDTSETYVFAELYATDRDDIPEGLPANSRRCLSSIWRIGHFNLAEASNHNIRNKNLKSDYKADFKTVRLTFHYDPRLAQMEDVDIVKVYRCADEDSGEWECVGTAIPSSADPFVQTEDFGPASDLYNFGWFAIVGEKLIGTVITVR